MKLIYYLFYLIILYIILRFVRRKLFEIKTKLPYFIKVKSDKKFKKLLSRFKKRNRRNPTKKELFRIIIGASHHTFPVKGRNVRRWTKGKVGHWNRQKIRKYLLEKHKVVKNYKMR